MRPLNKAATFISIIAISLLSLGAWTQAKISERPGWVITQTSHSFDTLVERVLAAAKTHKIGVVSHASATVGAKNVLNITIPGNAVIGLYHPRFAIPMLEASIAAGIEAPIRVYVTENGDGTATLSYKMPSHVFKPYFDEGGDKLRALSTELDQLFASLSKEATGSD